MGNYHSLSLIPFYQPMLSSNWVWRELVRRDLASKNKEAGIEEMKDWDAELTAKAGADTASAGRSASGLVTSAAAAAGDASPSASSAMSTVALGPTLSTLATDPDAGHERAWKELYVKL